MDPVINNVVLQWGAVGVLFAVLMWLVVRLWQRCDDLLKRSDEARNRVEDRMLQALENNTRVLTELSARIQGR